ncbi:MAG: RHS repeat-associated core domain-containing protein, partial [Azoarcus sp.]|nr:RHS repeat-associated core domain-containing protein [Azoarcus sp.]
NLVTHRKRSGDTVTLAYDNLNRLTTRSYPTTADNVAFAYDLLGRRTQAKYANNSHTVSYAWDGAGRMTSTQSGTKVLSYQYDPAGNRTRLTWPESTFYVTTTYDALNRPTAIKELGTTNLAAYAYDDLSRRTTVTLGNGTTTTYGYSTQGTLASLAHNLTGTAQDQTTTYTRNAAREITGHSWTNDLYQWAGDANGTKSYTTNRLNQYTAAAGATITHDTKGNLTGDGTWTYAFDTDNKLKSAAKTGYSATLTYDAEGRLDTTTLAGVVTALRYDGTDLVAEYNSAGTLVRRYVHGPGVDEPLVWYEGTGTTDKRWLYADHLGTIVGQANAAGTSTAIYSYGPYGEPNVTTGTRFRYTGQQYLGGLNLYYYKARFYSPALGRFLQTDPIGTRDDLNLYAYVGNNPVNFSDPTGLTAAEAALIKKNFASGFFDTRSVMEAPSTAANVGSVTRSIVDTGAEVVGYGLIAFDIANTVTGIGAGPDTGIVGAALLGATRNAAKGGSKDVTYLYQKLSAEGTHLKYGITKNPATRYTQEQLAGGRLKILTEGSRKDMLKLERDLHETLPIGREEAQKFYIQKQIDKGLKPPPYSGQSHLFSMA